MKTTAILRHRVADLSTRNAGFDATAEFRFSIPRVRER